MKRFSTILSLLLAVLLVFTSCAALAETPVEKHVVSLPSRPVIRRSKRW